MVYFLLWNYIFVDHHGRISIILHWKMRFTHLQSWGTLNLKPMLSLKFIVTSEVLYLPRPLVSSILYNSYFGENISWINLFGFDHSMFKIKISWKFPCQWLPLITYSLYICYYLVMVAWLTNKLIGTMKVVFHQYTCGKMIMKVSLPASW